MKEQIQTYLQRMRALLTESPASVDYANLRAEHLIHIGFYQHERLIHLIVTMTMAVLLILTLIAAVALHSLGFGALAIVLLGLEIAYLFHYYFLENSVQELYRIDEELVKRSHR